MDESHLKETILGIDIGSVTLSMVQTDYRGNILQTAYRFHRGRIIETIIETEKDFDLSSLTGIAHLSGKGYFKKEIPTFDTQTSIIEAVKKLYPLPGALLYVGAARFHLVNFDEKGNYTDTITNTSCAAGTGSFLDQQAERLKIDGITGLCQTANRNRGEIPEIASRCAVFAKTDLIHTQQAGYGLESICDSLCKGLAKNIYDTLFSDASFREPVIFGGGVSKNQAVRRHLETMTGTRFEVPEISNLLGAYGACLQIAGSNTAQRDNDIDSLSEILTREEKGKEYYHSPLKLKLSTYPDFSSGQKYLFDSEVAKHPVPVQVENYKPGLKGMIRGFLGIDIGSTSTKAIITGEDSDPIAGFYTYTTGQPVRATRAIFEAIACFTNKNHIDLQLSGTGTTGSGRKFIGNIIGADLVLDEITAHARAAYELNPDTDTIIEIGGQDSKFTLMHDGNVTFSEMNSVCAAGTGSFIEELAGKLGVALDELSERAENSAAPLASDRCTVFMERDINQYLANGYSVDECLASVLHSVRENYLRKVATEGAIGKNVCFQGATARNRALVAAFESRLGKKIFVSRYCHLTGALGVALYLKKEGAEISSFRGLDLYKKEIAIRTETCALCNNRCNIRVTTVKGEKIAYGFLCGRDYETGKYIERNPTGFDMIRERRKLYGRANAGKQAGDTPVIGIPAALHLYEETSLWSSFFSKLGIRSVSSSGITDSVKQGKKLAGAEFCSPIDSMYGHVEWLADRCDKIFVPVYLESRNKENGHDRLYCYYSQFSPPLVSLLREKDICGKIITPLLNNSKDHLSQAREIYYALEEIMPEGKGIDEVSRSWKESLEEYYKKKEKLSEIFNREIATAKDISVVLLGRPYLVLDPAMNKGIPEIFQGMGHKTFFHDMVPENERTTEELNYLLSVFPWYFAAQILKAAGAIASMDNVYPVFITAFKCAPDSFVLQYFRKIMEKQNKPYLILQIDEHDSSVGYETRIEAAIRSFKNHAATKREVQLRSTPVIVPPERTLSNGKILLFPNWDPISAPLLVANLQRSGIDARLLESSDLSIRKSMVHNNGQCLPLNIIAQNYINYIEKYDLDPGSVILWMTETMLSCNIRMYPYYIKTILDSYGHGLEKATVYSGDISHLEISINTTYHAYFAYMFGGILRRMGNHFRPYEANRGDTDRVLEESLRLFITAFKGKYSIEKAAEESSSLFDQVERKEGSKPKVAIFGDFYVRDNDIMNQGLVTTIEKAGGEVINTPYTDFTKLTANSAIRRRAAKGRNLEAIGLRTFLSGLKLMERKYYKPFERHLGKFYEFSAGTIENNLSRFNLNPYHSGESYDNLLKIFYLLERYPDVSLFVQTNPGFCCPSLVTEAMKTDIRRITGVPVLTITYDGTSESRNELVVPYIKFIRKRQGVTADY